MKNITHKIIIILIIFIFLGCTPSTMPEIQQPKKTQLVNSNIKIIEPSRTIRISIPTDSVNPIDTIPIKTPMIFPSINQNTPTSIFEEDKENIKENVENFIKNNGKCNLPCLFGLFPGKSTIRDISEFRYFFQKNSIVTNDQINGINISSDIRGKTTSINLEFWKNNVVSFVIITAYINDTNILEKVILTSWASIIFGKDPSSIIQEKYDSDEFHRLMSNFSLSYILSNYGLPKTILLFLFPTGPFEQYDKYKIPTTLVIYYPKQGFLIQYIMVGREDGEDVVACPIDSFIEISTWDKNNIISLAEATKYLENYYGINENNINDFKPIQDVTKLSINEFSNIFKNPNTKECIRTPKENWILEIPLK